MREFFMRSMPKRVTLNLLLRFHGFVEPDCHPYRPGTGLTEELLAVFAWRTLLKSLETRDCAGRVRARGNSSPMIPNSAAGHRAHGGKAREHKER